MLTTRKKQRQATQTEVYIIMTWSFQETEIEESIRILAQESAALYV